MSAIMKPEDRGTALEALLIGGDLSRLNAEQRVDYYRQFCEALDLNAITRPFDYLNLGGKLVLYANKGCTEQLRMKRAVSLRVTKRERLDDIYFVEVEARQGERVDFATGAVAVGALKGNDYANAIMKAETKAKRRATLSICGLGMIDESEVETIPGAIRVAATTVEAVPAPALKPAPPVEPSDDDVAGFAEPASTPESIPAPKPSPAPVRADPPAELYMISDVPQVKAGVSQRGPWTLWHVKTVDGRTFGTFDKKVAGDAMNAKELDLPCQIAYATTAKGNLEITALRVLDEVPEPPQAVPPDIQAIQEAFGNDTTVEMPQTATAKLARKIKGR